MNILVDNFKERLSFIVQLIMNKSFDIGISNISIPSDHESNVLLGEWNNTSHMYPNSKLIHKLFEDRAAIVSQSTAAVYQDQSLSYQQLNEQANQVAHYLQSLGVGPDTVVATTLERSLDFLIVILGILKAGGPTYH